MFITRIEIICTKVSQFELYFEKKLTALNKDRKE